MSYQASAQLTADSAFNGRSRSAATEQALHFKDDQRPAFVELANAVLRSDGDTLWTFVNLNANGPGIGAKVDNGDGTIDQSKVTDADLLSLTQSNWTVIAALYFPEGPT
jgi:hypothetical protein